NTYKDNLLMRLLLKILTKLNDKKMYLFVTHLKYPNGNENTLMNKENSNNCIWKTDNDTDIQLLAFGLMIFNPCIQLSCDDNNINFGILNELIKYHDEQAIHGNFQLINPNGLMIILTMIFHIFV
ncbi:hypothetical protein RFI_39164, partial [Reticulomyxa filosa]